MKLIARIDNKKIMSLKTNNFSEAVSICCGILKYENTIANIDKRIPREISFNLVREDIDGNWNEYRLRTGETIMDLLKRKNLFQAFKIS